MKQLKADTNQAQESSLNGAMGNEVKIFINHFLEDHRVMENSHEFDWHCFCKAIYFLGMCAFTEEIILAF